MRDFMAYLGAVHGRPIKPDVFEQRARAQLAANKNYVVTAGGPDVGQARFHIDHFSRSLCFVAPHWGNYTATFVQCAFALPDGQQFLAFRGNQWGGDEAPFWRRVNSLSERRVELFHTDRDRNMLPLLRRMRQGAHLFALYDLFSDYGDTESIKVFDSRLETAFGWARLCYLADAIVVSIAPLSLERSRVEIFDVIDPRQFGDPDRFLAACRRSAGRSLELLLAEQPAYWFMWEHLQKYVPQAEGEGRAGAIA
jgi:lauroyl/myristoyl acyltransferase